jgi:hypothetical protein
MAATKSKSKSSSKSSSSTKSKASQPSKAAKDSAAQARTGDSGGATRRSELEKKSKDELVEDAIRRPAQPNIDAEVALPDVQKFLRDNPGLRAADNSRRTLPVEEFPKDDPVRKAHDKALETIDKAVSSLETDVAGIDPVLDQKIKVARRVLQS